MYVRLADGLSAAGLTARVQQRGDWRPPGRTGRLDWLGGTGGTGETGGRRAVRARRLVMFYFCLPGLTYCVWKGILIKHISELVTLNKKTERATAFYSHSFQSPPEQFS